MPLPRSSRRRFLAQGGVAFIAFLGLHRLTRSQTGIDESSPYGPLQADPEGLLDLPDGFRYRVISRSGERMDDGLPVPGKPDGMAAFAGPDGQVVLVRNHENGLSEPGRAVFSGDGPFAVIDAERCYDPGDEASGTYLGGTTNLVFDPEEGVLLRQFASLLGSDRNCAGGAMPWGTWITCEESQDLLSDRSQQHGWCFEVPATAEPDLQRPVPLKALGRFRHEAVALDPASGILYLTEDRNDGLLYRFVPEFPDDPARRFQHGRLQALAIDGKPGADLRNYSRFSRWPVEGETLQARWIDLEDTHAPKDDLRLRGHAAGAARFARGEGIHFTEQGIFIACTDGGPDRRGQIFRLLPSGNPTQSDGLELFLQSDQRGLLNNGDNLCPAPWGDLIVCEDLIDSRFAAHTHLRGVTPDGEIYSLARNARDDSEFAGCCFSPDGRWLFANLQSHGLTLAITGPWKKS